MKVLLELLKAWIFRSDVMLQHCREQYDFAESGGISLTFEK